MDKEALLNTWLAEEQCAHIHGWDFSHIAGRYQEEADLPWDYRETIGRYLTPDARLLDIDTGGGEFLLSLEHPRQLMSAMESYPPNVKLCQETLPPPGVEFRAGDGSGVRYPFEDQAFDLILNRHGDFNPVEIGRLLKPGGVFITQQVGAENDRELVELLLDPVPALPFPGQYPDLVRERFEAAGFETLEALEAFGAIRFQDVGALVWFARVIPWEFPGFCVRDCLPGLYRAQERLERDGVIEGRTHRFLLVARKTGCQTAACRV